MPNQRGPGQRLVAFPLDEQFLAEIDEARGSQSRSEFVREAIYRLLKEKGRHLPAAVVKAPDRAGKGGRKKKSEG